MKSIKESIFLLTSTPYRDADLIINLLSSQHGKLSAVIYSGRRIGKAGSFSFQPGDLLDLEYQVRENTDFIKILNVSGKSTLNPSRFSYNRFLFHAYLLELISRISQPGNPSDDLFDIMLKNLHLQWRKGQQYLDMARFIWLLGHHGGFGIDYHGCGACQNPSWRFNDQQEAVFRKETYQFQTNSGTLLCGNCAPISDSEETITPAMLKVMWILDTSWENREIYPEIPVSVLISVIKCLNNYLLQRYDLRPKSLSMFLSSLTSP